MSVIEVRSSQRGSTLNVRENEEGGGDEMSSKKSTEQGLIIDLVAPKPGHRSYVTSPFRNHAVAAGPVGKALVGDHRKLELPQLRKMNRQQSSKKLSHSRIITVQDLAVEHDEKLKQ